MAAIEAGKHVLCEKPVAFDFRQTRRPSALAREKGLKTKLGFTFRYSPGVQYARELIDEGFVGRPVHLQRLRAELAVDRPADAAAAGRPHGGPVDGSTSPRSKATARRSSTSATGGSGADYSSVVGTMRNFIPERMVRATGQMMRMNIDDGDIFMAEYTNGAIGSIQTSFVTVGNYPGIEARIYGERGRDHLPAGRGVRRRRDDQGRPAGRRRVHRAGDPRALLSRPAGTPASRGARCSTPT